MPVCLIRSSELPPIAAPELAGWACQRVTAEMFDEFLTLTRVAFDPFCTTQKADYQEWIQKCGMISYTNASGDKIGLVVFDKRRSSLINSLWLPFVGGNVAKPGLVSFLTQWLLGCPSVVLSATVGSWQERVYRAATVNTHGESPFGNDAVMWRPAP